MTDTSIRISRRTLSLLRVRKVLGGYRSYDELLDELLEDI